jgi:hypothetical protein
MREACSLIWTALIGLFRSRASLAAEILVLRHQINVLRRNSPKRQTFSLTDRLIFARLYRWLSLSETLIRLASEAESRNVCLCKPWDIQLVLNIDDGFMVLSGGLWLELTVVDLADLSEKPFASDIDAAHRYLNDVYKADVHIVNLRRRPSRAGGTMGPGTLKS